METDICDKVKAPEVKSEGGYMKYVPMRFSDHSSIPTWSTRKASVILSPAQQHITIRDAAVVRC